MNRDSSPDAAETVYSRARGALGAGEELDIEALCRAHPALAKDLRRNHRVWLRVRSLVDRLGFAIQVDQVLARLESEEEGTEHDPD